MLALLLAGPPALADGGRGGNPAGNANNGGTTGIDNPTGVGGSGGVGTVPNAGGGGGGAGAVTGGAGGISGSGPSVGRGGAGGVHGSVDAALPPTSSTGSDGGAGGHGGAATGGGGGGAGGYGAVVTGTGVNGVVSGAITGGKGGKGGDSAADYGGSGGSGGTGLLFTDGSATTNLMVNGSVQGGNGGARGLGAGINAWNGAYGAGGAGIVGSNLSITNNGTIAGGLSGDGVTRAAAIRFTGGSNSLTFGNATSGLTGGIVIEAGTLSFAQPTDVTVDSVVSGAGAVIKTGAGTLTLTGANSYAGGTTIAGGKVSVSSDGNLGDTAGGITLNGGALQATASFSTARTVDLISAGTVEVDAGQSLTMSGVVSGAGGLTKSGGGTLVLSGANTYGGGTTIASGTLSVSSDGNLGDVSGSLTFGGGTLLVTGSFVSARTMTLNVGGTIEVAAGQAFTQSGVISGSGGLTKSGAGELALSGTNTYMGGTTIAGGRLSVSTDANLGAASGGLTLDGGTLVASGFGTARAVTLGSSGGTIEVASGQNLSHSGTISGTGDLIKSGDGWLILSGSSTYSGATTVSAGTLYINGAGALSAASDYTIAAGALLDINDGVGTVTAGSIAGAGSIRIEQDSTLEAGATNASTIFSGVISDRGSLRKVGSGTLTLTGNNSYAGGTTITGGKLAVGADVNLGAASGGLTLDGGTLLVTSSFSSARTVTLGSAGGGIEVDSGVSFAHSGTISGTGGLTKSGTGQLSLSGSSTYSGATTVSAGTLYIDRSQAMSAASDYTVAAGALLNVNDTLGTVTAGSIAGAGQLRIENGSTLETGATNASTTFTGMIYDAGSIRKVGTGTLTLTQENTYSGGTTIAGGAISISKDSNLGSTSGALTLDGGVLQVTGTTLNGLARNIILGSNGGGFDIVEAGNSFIVNQSLSGTGSLSKTGAGTLVLKGASSYSGTTTVSGGTLRAGVAGAFSSNSAFTVASGATLDLAGFSQTIGSLAGTGTVTLGSGTLTAGANNSSTTFSGTITGTGGVTKRGTGTLTLTGTNTYTGSTKVSSGKLVVNGSLASTVTLDGGTLGGSGTIAGVSVGSGATVAPGNSIGTLTVSGNVSFASGSTYQVEVNAAGQSDRIVASGSATLSGGTVQVLAESGNYAASTNYTILTASGGVNGTFTSVTSNLAFLTPSLSYGGTNVTLTMTRNDTSFGPDNSGGSSGGTSVAATRNQGFIAMAAERLGVGNPVYDALISATAEEARAGFDLLSGEAHAQAVSVMIDESRLVRDTILGHLRGPLLTQAPGQVAGAFTADLPGRKSGIVMPAPVPQPRYALWGTAFGSTGNTDADGNAASLSRRSGGALLGADVMLYEAPGSSLKVGVAGGYSQSRFDLDARLSTGKLESGHAALYAGARFGQLRLDAGAAYTWSESDIRRQVAIRGFGDLLRLQRPGSVTQGFAELGYGFTFQGIALEPFAQLALIRVSTDAGTERGGATALRVLSSDQTLGFTTLGLRAEAQLGAMPLFARAMLGWRHGFGELTPQARTAFVAGTTPAQVFAAPIDRDALTAEAGLDWRISSATALGLTYSAAIGERSRDHALKGRVEMRF
ncbi:autotransporter-associated beta strand repeat-containing protein [Bosea sp. 46]|uniref:autotransporter-associated beta strand repeat-containing protein n=5 Tax=Bosea TaxID=85413 RepID=UPI001AEF3064|nr:autotransporter-associated beta strand repeat-containing protein [Bosea sp. 46]